MKVALRGISMFVCLYVIAACGEGPHASHDLTLTVPPTISTDDLKTVRAALPKIQRACPGLTKYAAELGKATIPAGPIEDYSGLGRHYVLTLLVANPAAEIPRSYHANGHTCYLYVNTPEATVLTIPKRACVSVCLDRDNADDDVRLPLR